MAAPKALKWTLAGSLLAIPIVGFLVWKGFSSAFLGDVAGAEAALESERAAARREGLPIEPEELFPDRPIDPKLNAGPTIAKECSAIHRLTPADGPFRKAMAEIRKGNTGPESTIRGHLATLKPQIDRLMAVIDRPYCDFGKDYSLGAYVLFPEFAHMKSTVYALVGKAWIDSRDGRFAEAGSALIAAFRLAKFAGAEPVMLGFIVQIAYRSIAHSFLRQIVTEHGLDQRCRAMAHTVLSKSGTAPDVILTFRGELVGGIASIRTIKSIKEIESLSSGSPLTNANPDSIVPSMRKAWEARYIQFWRRILHQLPADKQDFLAIGRILTREAAWENSQKSMDHLMNRIILLEFEPAMQAACRERAQYALSNVMLTLLEYHAQHKSFPDRLDQMKGKFIDPFDRKPLRYSKQGNGFRIYSIDRDLKDDGRLKPPPGTPITASRDLVVTYP